MNDKLVYVLKSGVSVEGLKAKYTTMSEGYIHALHSTGMINKQINKWFEGSLITIHDTD